MSNHILVVLRCKLSSFFTNWYLCIVGSYELERSWVVSCPNILLSPILRLFRKQKTNFRYLTRKWKNTFNEIDALILLLNKNLTTGLCIFNENVTTDCHYIYVLIVAAIFCFYKIFAYWFSWRNNWSISCKINLLHLDHFQNLFLSNKPYTYFSSFN